MSKIGNSVTWHKVAELNELPEGRVKTVTAGNKSLITGLWDCKVDRPPALAITGQVNVQVLGSGAFQDTDLASAFEAVAGFSETELHSSKHGELMSLACKNAIVDREPAQMPEPRLI